MKKIERITAKITSSDLVKIINNQAYYTIESFIDDAQDYIKAAKQGRALCFIESISNMGNLKLKFMSCEKNKTRGDYYYRNYFSMFQALGYKEAGRTGYFKISFGNMDMVFNTHYNIIHTFKRLGFISKSECDALCQKTPSRF